MNLCKDEKQMIIELICNEQTHMIIKNNNKYKSDRYKKLEKLKIRIKDLWNACFKGYRKELDKWILIYLMENLN